MAIPKEEDQEKGEEKLVFDIRLTSAVPGKITGENKTKELKGIDLAMKLHYLNGLYFFTNNNTDIISDEEEKNTNGFLSSHETKEPLFNWLISYFMACGRVRTSTTETGAERPTMKLNDAGIRIIEAQSSKTVEEWLAMENFLSLQDLLIYDHALGPDLPFSPLVCIQMTWFRCGGIALGLSWAHVLGDAFAASEFMNMFGQYMQGHFQQPKTLTHQDPLLPKYPPSNLAQEPTSVKRVNPVGNHWVLPTNCKMGIHTLHLTPKQLDQLHSRVHGSKMNGISTNQCFELITAIMWRSIAKIRDNLETNFVTICRPKTIKRQQVIPYNGQVLGTLEAGFLVSTVDPLKLIRMIDENVVDESDMVEELVNKEISKFDFFAYGANLTFVDMEEADIYGFLLKGKCPRFASYTIGGIGDKGAVLVLPGPKDGRNDGELASKVIVLLLPENEIEPLKDELKKQWCIA